MMKTFATWFVLLSVMFGSLNLTASVTMCTRAYSTGAGKCSCAHVSKSAIAGNATQSGKKRCCIPQTIEKKTEPSVLSQGKQLSALTVTCPLYLDVPSAVALLTVSHHYNTYHPPPGVGLSGTATYIRNSAILV